MTSTSSLLIVNQGALGDLVCIFPILEALRRHFCPVAILCQGHIGRLAAAEHLVDAWFPIEAAWVASLFTDTPAAEARQALAPFSHILVFSNSAILASSLQQIGGARLERVPPRPPAGLRLHVAEHALNCLRDDGWLPEAAVEALQRKTSAFIRPVVAANEHGSKDILLHPGAGSPRKRWPLEGFLWLAAQINARHLNPEFVIGPAEQDLLSELKTHGAIVHRPADAINLLNLFRSARAYVGNDSGASHLAAWGGLPSVVIFGPTDPVRWRPLGSAVEIVQPALECRPCFETDAANCDAEYCLAATTPENVLAALERLILVGPSGTSGGEASVPSRT